MDLRAEGFLGMRIKQTTKNHCSRWLWILKGLGLMMVVLMVPGFLFAVVCVIIEAAGWVVSEAFGLGLAYSMVIAHFILYFVAGLLLHKRGYTFREGMLIAVLVVGFSSIGFWYERGRFEGYTIWDLFSIGPKLLVAWIIGWLCGAEVKQLISRVQDLVQRFKRHNKVV